MPRIEYLDFELRIERARGGGYRAVTSNGTRSVEHRFPLPFTDEERQIALLTIGGRHEPVRRLQSTSEKKAEEFGDKLYQSVFGGAVGSTYDECARAADNQERGLRLRLQLDAVPELADLPWELLYRRDTRRFIATSNQRPLVRLLSTPEPVKSLAVRPPLRALVMISCPPGCEPLDVEAEWRELQEALAHVINAGALILDRLDRPTLKRLRDKLKEQDYHIFHFIGHGGLDPDSQEGVLVMENDAGTMQFVSGKKLATILHDEKTLRLAVINACEGARATRDDAFAGVAQTLVLGGIPAVIAMQFELRDSVARQLTQEFYKPLAEGMPVDTALAEARKALFSQGDGAEWATPVLYLRSPDGYIFDVQSPPVIPPAPPRINPHKPQPQPIKPEPTRKPEPPLQPRRPEPVQTSRRGMSAWVWLVSLVVVAVLAIVLTQKFNQPQPKPKPNPDILNQPPAGVARFHVREDGDVMPGMFTLAEIAQQIRAGDLGPDGIQIQEESGGGWREASRTAELASAIATARLAKPASPPDFLNTLSNQLALNRGAMANAAPFVSFMPGAWDVTDSLGMMRSRFFFAANGVFSGISYMNATGLSLQRAGTWSYNTLTGVMMVMEQGEVSMFRLQPASGQVICTLQTPSPPYPVGTQFYLRPASDVK